MPFGTLLDQSVSDESLSILMSYANSRSWERDDHDAFIVADKRNLCLSSDERGESDEEGEDDAFE